MLSNSRKGSFSFKASGWLARVGQCASVLRNMLLENGFRHVLLNPVVAFKKYYPCTDYRSGTKIGKQCCFDEKWPKRMYYPLFIKATFFTIICATAIVSTWVVLLKGYNRIKQHVSKTILQKHISQDQSALAHSCKAIRSFKAETSFSAIGQHLLQSPACTCKYNNNKFSILAHGRTSFHLSTLEATYIKTSKPNLCKQKEFLYGLKITH